MKKYILIIFGLLVAPVFVHAEVSINEVAWMGTPESQYGEWVELYNDGESDVNLSGWKLYEAGGSTLIFTLTKSIPANGYLVIERTTASAGDPLPGVSGESGSFGGSGLSNTGEHLVLKNSTGATIDSVDALSGWPAGDATTKETMQKSGSAWVTAEGTPNEQNSGGSQNNSSDTDEVDTIEEAETETAVPILYASISGPTILAAHIAGTFTPKTGWTDGTLLAVGKFFWNFGDGETITKETSDPVYHTYARSGKYVVVLEYSKSRSAELPDIVAKFIVTVPNIPIMLSITKDNVIVKNIGSSEVDISNFILQSQKNVIIIPRGTILLAGSEIVYSRSLFGAGEQMSLLYPNNTLFATASSATSTRTATSVVQKRIASTKEAAQVSSSALLANVASAQVAEGSPSGSGSSKVVIATGGLILLIATAVILFLKLRKNKNPTESRVTANDIKIIESEE